MYGAIPTIYNGLQFRSRLEATWACMFDLLAWKWEYEPYDLKGYIPDFIIRGYVDQLVEVKPETSVEVFMDHRVQFPQSHPPILGFGCTPMMEFWCPLTETINDSVGGVWIDDSLDDTYMRGNEKLPFPLDIGRWADCPHCNRKTLTRSYSIPKCLMCGQETPWPKDDAVDRLVQILFASAKNTVQWKGNG